MTKTIKPAIKTIALAGNPNVGKSAFFTALTKVYVDVSNYPGTTIEITSTLLNDTIKIQDTPGVYGVSSFNDEERVARDIILYSDAVINIVSAISLERDLFLTKQLIEMGKPIILIINQMDELLSLNFQIDIKLLEKELGIPVFCTTAITGEGIDQVKQAILNNEERTGNIDPVLKNELIKLLPQVTNQSEALLLLEGDLTIAERYKIQPQNRRNEIYARRRKEVNDLILKIINKNGKKNRSLTHLSNILINPIYGTIIGLSIGYLFLYQFLGVWIGGYLINITEKQIMSKYYEPLIKKATAAIFPADIILKNGDHNIIFTFQNGYLQEKNKYNELLKLEKDYPKTEKNYYFSPQDYIEKEGYKTNLNSTFLSSIGTILSGQYGILTLTVTYLFGLLLPLVIAFYASLAILEDSGYLPRLAVLMDGILIRLGMNGRAIIPLILGLGCVTMASVTTRLLTTKREKIIALTVLGFAIPCSAQLGVIQSLLAKNGGVTSWLIWISILIAVLLVTGIVMNKFLPGKSTPLLLDLPPLRFPRLKNIYSKTKNKVTFFMLEAIPAFFIAAFIVSVLQVTGILKIIISIFEPISEKLLLLPKEVSISFILGMVRRDFGAFGLTDLTLTPAQVTVASVVLTLFVPCIATVSVMAKEQSWKVACGIWVSSIILSIGIGAILARIII